MLPGWGDGDIMKCDLVRLHVAIDAARDQSESDWRQRYRIGGFQIEEPTPEPTSDEAFNAQLRATLGMFRKAE